jgi:hypothetical protein
MAELTAEEYFPQDTFHWQWGIFWTLALLLAAFLWWSFYRPVRPPVPPMVPHSAGYDWYMVLHLPEIPHDPAKSAVAQKSLEGWLNALTQNGYKPLLLSDVDARLRQGVRTWISSNRKDSRTDFSPSPGSRHLGHRTHVDDARRPSLYESPGNAPDDPIRLLGCGLYRGWFLESTYCSRRSKSGSHRWTGGRLGTPRRPNRSELGGETPGH